MQNPCQFVHYHFFLVSSQDFLYSLLSASCRFCVNCLKFAGSVKCGRSSLCSLPQALRSLNRSERYVDLLAVLLAFRHFSRSLFAVSPVFVFSPSAPPARSLAACKFFCASPQNYLRFFAPPACDCLRGDPLSAPAKNKKAAGKVNRFPHRSKLCPFVLTPKPPPVIRAHEKGAYDFAL